MFIKKCLGILSFLILTLFSFAATDNRVDVETDEATVDFMKEEFSADGGVTFVYPNVDPEKTSKIKAFKLKKLTNKNLILASDGVIFQQGQNKIEAKEIYFNMDTQGILVKDGISYVTVNGAPVLNDKIYYGGEEFVANFPDEASVKNAWFTTSKKALNLKSFNSKPGNVLPYHMKAKKIVIYPDNKIVAYNAVLYAGKVPILWLPWYASSLKADTNAPLFPIYGSTGTEGQFIMWGLDYGRKNNYLNGSLALKITEKKGLYIGQWDDVYKIGGKESNKGKLSLSDALIVPKGGYETEYKFEHTHNYKSKYGTLDWKYSNQTINTINSIRDQLEEYKSGVITSYPYSGVEKKLQRFELATDLSGMGPEDDMSLKANIQYVNNKEFIQTLLGEIVKTQATDTQNDNDIKSSVDFKKENFKYGLNLKYDYLDDLDPGSQYADTLSKTDGILYGLNLKKYGFNLKIEEKKWDSWEALDTLERNNNGVALNAITGWAYGYSYVPFTAKKYDLYKNEKKLTLGTYTLFKGSVNYSLDFYQKEETSSLSRVQDPFRVALSIAERQKEYYRDINILSTDTIINSSKLNLNHANLSLGLELGTEDEKYVDRTRNDNGVTYVNNSTYYDLQVRDKVISFGDYGNLDLTLGRRLDNFDHGDNLNKYYVNGTHGVKLYDNSGDYLRRVDLNVNNNFGFYYNFYDFDKNNYNFNSSSGILNVSNEKDLAAYRLNSRKNRLELNDNITLGLGNTGTTYGINVKKDYNSNDKEWLQENNITNSIDFNIDAKRSVYLSYNFDEINQKNDRDISSVYYNKFNEEYFLEQKNNTLSLTLADDIKDFTYSHTDYKKRNREKDYRYLNSLGSALDLGDITTTYGDVLTTETSSTNSVSYGFLLNKDCKIKLGLSLIQSDIYNNKTFALNSKGDTNKISFEINKNEVHTLTTSLSDYKDVISSINDEKRLILRYDYKKNTLPKSGNEKNVELTDENGEDRLALTEEELIALDTKYKEEKRKEKGLGVDIMGIGEDEKDVIYKEYYSFYLDTIRNEDYFKASGDLIESMKYVQLKAEAHYKRLRLTYDFAQASTFVKNTAATYGITNTVSSKEHTFSLLTMIGQSSHSWKIKAGVSINGDLDTGDPPLDKWNIYLGKEFDFIETAVEYEVDWNTTTNVYDWVWRIKLALLTFPDKGLNIGTSHKKDSTSDEFQAGI